MRMLILVLVIGILSITACQSTAPGNVPPDAGDSAAFATTPDAGQENRLISLASEGFAMHMHRPESWESFTTEYGVVMGEAFGSVASGGELEGVMAYVFASPLHEFDLATNVSGQNVNHAQAIQSSIITDPFYIGESIATEPVGFVWDGWHASYYLLRDEELTINTMVVAIVVSESNVLLTLTISAPFDQSDRILEVLPGMLRELNINDKPVSLDVLDVLPAPLDFPTR
jgi:hypothetical protein